MEEIDTIVICNPTKAKIHDIRKPSRETVSEKGSPFSSKYIR